jgi:hypothetical protein
MYLISECVENNTKKVYGYLSVADDKIDYYTWNNTCGISSSVILATEEEKQWYLACKKANKFIEKEKALKSFKQETKFIEGKWYKINNCWWAKFQTIHGSGTYWRYSEAISQSKIYTDLPHNLSDWKDVSIELLNDLSEIQAYLPEGHVDKIKKEVLVQTGFDQQKACATCKYNHNCSKAPHNTKGQTCPAIDGQHYPKEINTMKENVEEIPEYVELFKEGFDYNYLGRIFKTSEAPPWKEWTWKYILNENTEFKQYFRPLTASIYNTQFKKEEPVDLLAEAKKRYPISSKFKCPNGNKSLYESDYDIKSDTWTVTTYKIIRITDQDCVHSGNGYLYFNGKWATAISEVKQPEEKKWQVGGYIKFLKEYGGHPKGTISKINKVCSNCIYVNHKYNNFNDDCALYQSECEWVGMSKPSWYKEQQEKVTQHWSSWGTSNHLGYLGTKGDEKPVEKEQLYNITIKKSKVQQVEVVPLQKPCIISTRKSKFKLQIN